MPTFKGTRIILTAAVISYLLAITVNLDKYDLVLWPLLLGILSIIIYSIFSRVFPESNRRLIVALSFSFYLIYVGLALHFKANWPLIFW